MELVETTKMIQKGLQRFLNLRELQESVYDNVENWDEPETNIAEICWQCLEILNLVSERRGGEVLRELVVDLEMLLVPVLKKLMIWRHRSAKFIHSNKDQIYKKSYSFLSPSDLFLKS